MSSSPTPNDRELSLTEPNLTKVEKRELLQAHINTLDMIIGALWRRLLEEGHLDALQEWKALMRDVSDNQLPARFADLVIADMYRDYLELRLKTEDE